MFGSTQKKKALEIHEEIVDDYNKSYQAMSNSCEKLYSSREKAVDIIQHVERVINTIANTPKEFDTKRSKIGKEMDKFRKTEEYAKEAYDASVKAGVDIAGGVTAGVGIAAMAPSALMGIATTFGTASTGTAISALSGAAAQKAAAAWIGRTFVGFAVKEGAGMAAGQAFLALAGPVGWGITAVTTGVSLARLSKKNQKIADDAVEEAKDISKAREALDETKIKIDSLKSKTNKLVKDLKGQKEEIEKYRNADYKSLSETEVLYLGTLVNNALSLGKLLNETIE